MVSTETKLVTTMLRAAGADAAIDSDSSATSSMKHMLDAIDCVRASLGGIKGNQAFYEELLASLPQFFACGPQSAGKSW